MINREKFIINMLEEGLVPYATIGSIIALRNFINSSDDIEEIKFFNTIYSVLYLYLYINTEFRKKALNPLM